MENVTCWKVILDSVAYIYGWKSSQGAVPIILTKYKFGTCLWASDLITFFRRIFARKNDRRWFKPEIISTHPWVGTWISDLPIAIWSISNSKNLLLYQWSFLVPLIGGRYHIIPQLAVYTTYIPLIYCLLGDYITCHLLREPETAIDYSCLWIPSKRRVHGPGGPLALPPSGWNDLCRTSAYQLLASGRFWRVNQGMGSFGFPQTYHEKWRFFLSLEIWVAITTNNEGAQGSHFRSMCRFVCVPFFFGGVKRQF